MSGQLSTGQIGLNAAGTLYEYTPPTVTAVGGTVTMGTPVALEAGAAVPAGIWQVTAGTLEASAACTITPVTVGA